MSRILEPSTWAGLAAIVLGLKPFLPVQYAGFADLIASGFGGVAIFLREKSGQ